MTVMVVSGSLHVGHHWLKRWQWPQTRTRARNLNSYWNLQVARTSVSTPANEFWGKVIFLHLFVILFTGGCLLPGGVCSRGCWLPEGGVCSLGFGSGGSAPWGGGLLWGVSAPDSVGSRGSGPREVFALGVPGGCLIPGGCLVWGVPGPGGVPGGDPPDGYCCGRYASF